MDKKIGILLVNLGTPDSPTPSKIRKYLAEFLSDPRVIEMPKFIWKAILYGIILNVRPKKSAEKYKTIWTDQGSPLLSITYTQAKKLQEKLSESYIVNVAMRYGNPSIEKGIQALLARNVKEIVIFPLYPQYSAATTASVADKVGEVLKKQRYFPAHRVLGAYYQNDKYIKACIEHIRSKIQENNIDQYVFSYHGMPSKTYALGDPYYEQCVETTALIAQGMGESLEKFISVFQSRFGHDEWLQPYAYEYFIEAPKKNIKNIAVFCPGFSADCLETLEEMAIENKKIFIQAGGENYYFIPCLNANDAHIEVLVDELLS